LTFEYELNVGEKVKETGANEFIEKKNQRVIAVQRHLFYSRVSIGTQTSFN
jgi:hypothetical protein